MCNSVLLAFVVAITLQYSTLGQNSCNPRASNIGGDVLILDYFSLWYHGNHGFPGCGSPEVCSPQECCDICKTTPGCNAWVYCTKEEGCGSGCQEYADSISPAFSWKQPFVTRDDSMITENILPIKGFGPYSGCGNDDKWPGYMCSLKKVSDLDSPPETDVGGDEWVSGIVKPIPGCSDPYIKVCEACQGASDTAACLKCASQHDSLNEKLMCANCSGGDCQKCLDATATNGAGSTSQCTDVSPDGYSCAQQKDWGKCGESWMAGYCECTCKGGNSDKNDLAAGCKSCYGYSSYGDFDMDACYACVFDESLPDTNKDQCGMCIYSDYKVGNPELPQCLASF
eukprot:TRINITY_DN2736_c0_g1_i2.p1 TRINITY_DN2736_c0_g1~~TRINITY_DN2736_c0_g1_i2.p1  ORF type:complete len:341 (+),score=24.18 TRINITY_DN2736_c0_g1_i2:88-1110(+)